MAAASFHVRSISLPSQCHPAADEAEEAMNRVRRLKDSSICSSSSSAIGELYQCFEGLLQLPSTRQTLIHHRNTKWVDTVLDDSVKLLDVCGSIRDILFLVKEQAQEVQSILRMRRAGKSDVIAAYLVSRKRMNKEIKKHLKSLKEMDAAIDTYCDNSTLMKMSGELRAVSISTLSSVLSSMSMSKPVARTGRWALLSKAMSRGVVLVAPECHASMFERVDYSLSALRSQISSKDGNYEGVQDMQKSLIDLEVHVQAFESGLECMHRHLIKTRVSLLNILNK